MNTGHKVIKLVAMIFAVYLFVTIITGITVVFVNGAQFVFSSESDQKIDFVKNFENINSIEVESDRVAISIVPTDEEQITVKAEQVLDTVRVEQVGSKLVIENEWNILDFMGGFLEDTEKSSITIFIPKDTKLLEADIESGSGGLKVRDMNADCFILDGGSGDILISGLCVKEYEMDLGSGAVMITESNLADGELDSGSGKVNMQDCTVSDTEFSMGSGKMNYEGNLLGENSFDGGSGSINIKLQSQITDYNIYMDLGSGDGYINEKRVDDDYCNEQSDSNNIITIDGGSGSINLDFLE